MPPTGIFALAVTRYLRTNIDYGLPDLFLEALNDYFSSEINNKSSMDLRVNLFLRPCAFRRYRARHIHNKLSMNLLVHILRLFKDTLEGISSLDLRAHIPYVPEGFDTCPKSRIDSKSSMDLMAYPSGLRPDRRGRERLDDREHSAPNFLEDLDV